LAAPFAPAISYRHRAHPALHSFPTRRSSDLKTLEEALPGVEFVDISQASMWMRTIKSAEEHKLIREGARVCDVGGAACVAAIKTDRKSTRLNSSHVKISYAVFCLKKKIEE